MTKEQIDKEVTKYLKKGGFITKLPPTTKEELFGPLSNLSSIYEISMLCTVLDKPNRVGPVDIFTEYYDPLSGIISEFWD